MRVCSCPENRRQCVCDCAPEKTSVADPSSWHIRRTRGDTRKTEASRGALQVAITTHARNPLVDGRGAVKLIARVEWTWLNAADSGARGEHGVFGREGI